MKTLIAITLTMTALVLTGCKEKQVAQPAPPVQETVELPADLSLAAAPSDFIFVPEAYETLKAGDKVTIQALVGGSTTPFNDKYAIFTITNNTPEKACCPSCATDESVKATIQVKGDDGNVLKTTMKDFEKIAYNTKVTVIGTVDPTYEKGANLVINASKIHVHKE